VFYENLKNKQLFNSMSILIFFYSIEHSSGDEEIVVDALDVLQDCVEMEQPLVNDHIEVRLHSRTGMTSLK
jgi:hypothetical protein